MPGNIITITAQDIASWPTPNYVNPVERSWMPIYCGVLYGVGTLMVGLRIWLRLIKQAGGLGLDDALLVVAWLAGTMVTVVTIVACVEFHVDRHAWDVPFEFFTEIAKMAWLGQLAFLLTGGATKISVLLFYRRLVAGTYSQRWKWLVIMAIVFTAGWTIAFILTLIFNCTPLDAYWKAFNPGYGNNYKCVNTRVVNLLAGLLAVASDLYAVALPCMMTRHFELPRRQKVALNSVFCAGLIVVAASAVRTYYLYETAHSSDITWQIFNVYIWSQLELQLGIMCASAPALRVFFRKYLHATFSRSTRSRSGYDMADNVPSNKVSMIVDPESVQHISEAPKAYVPDQKQHADVDVSPVTESDFDTWSSAASERKLIRSPGDYEAYNMRNMEKYRDWAYQGRGRNFSQPFSGEKSKYQSALAPMPPSDESLDLPRHKPD